MKNPAAKITLIWIGLASLGPPWLSGCVGARPPEAASRPMTTAQQAIFEEGMSAYRDRDYEKAARRFQTMIGRFPGDPLLEEAQWMLGKSYESSNAVEAALREYRSFQNNFQDSSHRYEAALRIGFLEGLSVPKPAARTFERPVGIVLAGTPAEAPVLMERVRETAAFPGLRTIVLRGYGANGVYFRTDQAPVIEDRLSSTVAAAHAGGFKIWIQIPSRRLPWFKAPGEERDIRYDPIRGRMVSSEALDLFNPTTLDRLGRFYLDLAATGADGLVIDEDPWIGAWEGFSPAAQEAFLQDFGETLRPDRLIAVPAGGPIHPEPESAGTPLFWKWAGWKSRESLDRLARVIKTVRERHPSLVWVRILPPSAVTQPQIALARSGIDLLEDAQRGTDYFGVPLSFQQNPDGAFAVLSRMKELIGDSRRVMVLAPIAEEPWIASRQPDLSDTGLLFVEDEKVPNAPLTSPNH